MRPFKNSVYYEKIQCKPVSIDTVDVDLPVESSKNEKGRASFKFFIYNLNISRPKN